MKTIVKNKVFRQKRGETILEVIIALFVIVLGSGAATVLIVSAIQANTFSKDNLVALNLAVESVEAMRNIRDSNWLKYSYDKDACWNLKPGVVLAGILCDTNVDNLIPQGPRSINLSPGSGYWWDLSNTIVNPLNLSDTSAGYLASNESYRLGYNADGVFVPNSVAPEPSKFYRMVNIDYGGSPPQSATNMRITTLVQWKTGNTVHQVELQSYLTNYQN